MNNYKVLKNHYENCLEKYGDSNLGVDIPNEERVNLYYGAMLDLIKNKYETFTMLDFGCGLSHFYPFLLQHEYKNIDYTGCDISKKFIDIVKSKFPENKYFLIDLMQEDFPMSSSWDYVIANGVFTEKREMSYSDMKTFFEKMIKKLYAVTNKGLAFNITSNQVDWERDDLFHLSLDDLAWFLYNNNMRKYIIKNDYYPWQRTVYVYKEEK